MNQPYQRAVLDADLEALLSAVLDVRRQPSSATRCRVRCLAFGVR